MSLSRSRALLLLATVVVCASAVAGGTYLYKSKAQSLEARPIPELLNQLPSDAPALVYIDVTAIRALNQPALTSLLQAKPAKNAKSGDNDYQRFVDATGFDYSRDLDRVAIALWPAPPTPVVASSSPNSHGAPKPQSATPSLVIAEGRFDREKIEAYASQSGAVADKNKTGLHEIPGNPPVAFRLLSSSKIELASGKEAMARLEENDRPDAASAMRDLIERVSGSPVFAVAQAAPFSGNVSSSASNTVPSPGNFAKNIRAITFAGQPSGGGVDVTLEGQCESANGASGLVTVLNTARAFGSMALADPKSRGQMTKEQADALTALLAQIKIQQEEAWIRITLHITPDMLQAAAKQSNSANQR